MSPKDPTDFGKAKTPDEVEAEIAAENKAAKARQEANQAELKSLREQAAARKEMLAEQKEGLDMMRAEGKISEEVHQTLVASNDKRREKAEISRSSLEMMGREMETLHEIHDTESNRYLKQEAAANIRRQEVKMEEKQISLAKEKLAQADLTTEAGRIEALNAREVIVEKTRGLRLAKLNKTEGDKAVAQGEAMLKNLGQRALGQSRMGKAILGAGKGVHNMWKFARGLNVALKAGAISASMLTAALGIGIIVLIIGAIMKLVEWSIMLAVKTRDATVAFQRATGAQAEFGMQIVQTEHALRSTGVTMEEAHKAQAALYKSTSDYTMASKEQRDQLLRTAAVLGELGVSYADTAAAAQVGTKSMGMSIDETDDLVLGLSAHAQDIGVDIGTLVGKFGKMGGSLAKFGRDADRVFKNLATVSKVTGMEMDRILAITDKFDTFEGAAKQAGQLNAAIGGNMVNAMDLMMTTDPVERFNMLRDSIKNSAGSFDDMSYYQKKFYTQALGLKDVGELAAMMSGDFESLDGNIGKTSADFEDQRKQAQKWQSTMEILKNTLAQLAPTFAKLTPLINEMLEEFMAADGPLRDIGQIFEEFMSEEVLIPLLKDMPGMIKSIVDGLKSFSENIDQVILVSKIFLVVLAAIAVGIVAATWPAVAIGAAIAGVIYFVYELMKAFGKKRSPSFMDLFTGGVLEKGMAGVRAAIELMFAPIKMLGNLLSQLGKWFNETFNFSSIKESISGFVDWIPGEWGSSIDGIKTEMEISSPSKKMEREVMTPTFVQPMKSMAAQMPGLVEDVYADVDVTKATAKMAGIPGTPNGPDMPSSNKAILQGKAKAGTPTAGGTSTVVEKTHQNITIPVNIGGNEIGTIVADIVEGTLGNISLKGALGIG